MQKHLIWGNVEPIGDNNNDSSSTSYLESDGGQEGGTKCDAVRRLPDSVQAYLHSVKFQDDSSNSCEGSRASPTSDPVERARAQRSPGGAEGTAAEAPAEPNELEDEDALLQAMRQASEFWSVGSASHSKGTCKPCHYIHTKTGCMHGSECPFCHVPHTKKSRQKPGKSKREHCHTFFGALEELSRHKSDQFVEAMRSASSRSTYMERILERHLQHKEEQEEVPAPPAGEPRKKNLQSL